MATFISAGSGVIIVKSTFNELVRVIFSTIHEASIVNLYSPATAALAFHVNCPLVLITQSGG
jgi:hypothetical protein